MPGLALRLPDFVCRGFNDAGLSLQARAIS